MDKRIAYPREDREAYPKLDLNMCARSIINKKHEINIMVDILTPYNRCN